MARLKFQNEVPPLGFWYIQPQSRLRIDGESLDDTTNKVIAHRKYKGFEPVEFKVVRLEVERQICTRLGTYHCKAEEGDKWTPIQSESTMLSVGSIKAASKAAWEWLSSGRELVSAEQAKTRAELCQKCPINQPLTGCKCSSVFKIIERIVPKEKRFDGLGVCVVCQCSLPAKVWLPRNVIDASNAGQKLNFPQDGSCWQADPQG